MPISFEEAEKYLSKVRKTAEKIDNREAIRKLLGVESQGAYDYELLPRIGAAFRALGLIRRPLFLRGICGKLGTPVNKALETVSRRPYAFGYERQPFRAPHLEGLSDRNRAELVIGALDLKSNYDQSSTFYAEWAGYIDPHGVHFKLDALLAGAIDSGDEKVYEILIATIRGEHSTGVICRTVIRALLLCDRQEAWSEVVRLLLSAQREEGLRQTILDSVDEVHPGAFVRFLRVVIEHDLLRFSSSFRAFATWYPELWKGEEMPSAAKSLGRVLEFLELSESEPRSTDPTDVYLRLWADAFNDINRAIRRAESYLKNPEPAVRRAMVRTLWYIHAEESAAILKVAIADPDHSVASLALLASKVSVKKMATCAEFGPIIRQAAATWPKEKGVNWISRADAWDYLIWATPENKAESLCDVADEFSPRGRHILARNLNLIGNVRKRRDLALKMLGDASSDVRQAAARSLKMEPIAPAEAPLIEDLLQRKSADLRQAAIELLGKQPATAVLESGKRLIESKILLKRTAGLELLTELAEADRSRRSEIEFLFAEYAVRRTELTEDESRLIGKLKPATTASKAASTSEASISNGFGLYSLDQVIFSERPRKTEVIVQTESAIRCLLWLDGMIHQCRDREVTYLRWAYSEESSERMTEQLGNLERGFLAPRFDLTIETDLRRTSLPEVTSEWLLLQPEAARDGDGQEFVRAKLMVATLELDSRSGVPVPKQQLLQRFRELGLEPPKYQVVLAQILPWLIRQRQSSLRPSVILDLLSERIALIANDSYVDQSEAYFWGEKSWRKDQRLTGIVDMLEQSLVGAKTLWSDADVARYFRILRYIDEPYGAKGRPEVSRLRQEDLSRPGVHILEFGKKRIVEWKVPPRITCRLSELDLALQKGACTEVDVIDHLAFSSRPPGSDNLVAATAELGNYSNRFQQAVESYVARIVDIEVERGELPTECSYLVRSICNGVHLEQVRKLLAVNLPLGSRATDDAASRPGVFKHLLSVSRPRSDETPEVAATAFKLDKIKAERLMELAMLAPQWAAGVEIALGWKGYEEAVWWIHAHSKDPQWGIERGIKEIWAGEISERTPLSGERLLEGAVDVTWFVKVRSLVDEKRWKQIENSAKFAARGVGHTRAKLFAQSMQGEIPAENLIAKIVDKRNPDSVRALGLTPLGADREADVSNRYRVLQEFLRSSRQFGSMRQASEKLAVSIGMENLARTAGYPDPLRLAWALEAKEVEDLKDGGKVVVSGDLEVRLAFNLVGDPEITVSKKGVSLKEIPAAAKKVPEVKEIMDRRSALKKQTQRMRLALEQAMQRGDAFEAGELQKLMEHPGLAPLLRNLLFLGSAGNAGFLDETGKLKGESEALLIAHPHDLLVRGDWPAWQTAVFREERIQPFKQVFRELYPMTESERSAHESTRYAGHQLRPGQALAILSKRGWIVRHEEGVSKTLHELGLTARLRFEENFFSPADIEGLTLEGLSFTKSGSWNMLPLAKIPPKAFSETMRDLDLIVSVASMTGFDPEASESTAEMRAAVVREMASLMRLENVEIQDRFVSIRGMLAEYTVHLGSGLVQQRAKGELVILAVRQPQRGRLFLPFVDDDPRTAEVVSKVLLLARDSEMKDPSILSQIVGVR